MGLFGFLSLSLIFFAHSVFAFSDAVTTIASPIPVVGEKVVDGMIVSYDATNKTYKTTSAMHDENMFGVVVEDPVLYMRDIGTSTGVYPVVRFGEANVLVSDLNGAVQPGDLVTGSHMMGVGQRLDRNTDGYMLGYALEDVVYGDPAVTVSVDGESVRIGKVLVALRIGMYTPYSEEGGEENVAGDGVSAGALIEKDDGNGFDAFLFFRYLLGAFVAITAVVLALRRFGDLFAQSIISVGRNPLARSQIRSILVWNAVLIVIVSGVGLGIGIAIIAL